MYLSGVPVHDQIAVVPDHDGVNTTETPVVPMVADATMLIAPDAPTDAEVINPEDPIWAAKSARAEAPTPQLFPSWQISVMPVFAPEAARMSSEARARMV